MSRETQAVFSVWVHGKRRANDLLYEHAVEIAKMLVVLVPERAVSTVWKNDELMVGVWVDDADGVHYHELISKDRITM